MERYGGTKLERTRDLFEQCLASCPKEFAKGFYLLYAQLEEKHGLAKHSMTIYDRAVTHVDEKSQLEIFNVYIKKMTELFGLTHTRSIYEKAIEVLSDDQARDMCLRFADLERRLGEIDRARAVYAHASQLSDPRTCPSFWNEWRQFEIKHGNEDTIREMLRIKRSVQATFNTQVSFMSAAFVKATSGDDMKSLEVEAMKDDDDVEDVLKEATNVVTGKKDIMFVKSNTVEVTSLPETKTLNPDEIDLDEDMDQEEEEESVPEKVIRLQQKEVPKEVFGGLIPSSASKE
jgi:pre-mRNA-splicing factor SYF1